MASQHENWFETDEVDDVAGSLRHAVRCLDWVTDDPQAWKWFTLSIHSALQGACACHLVTTAPPIGVISDQDAAKWIEFLERRLADAKAPRTRLLVLPDLLEKVRQPNSAGDRSNARGVKITDDEVAWLSRIHAEVRNQFAHFDPICWSIDVSGLPAVGALVARIIGEIADMGWAFRRKDSDWLQALRNELAKLTR